MTSILNVLFVPVLAAGMLLLFFDRVFGTQFFIAGSTIKGGGDPILYQHLSGSSVTPEVYILILPRGASSPTCWPSSRGSRPTATVSRWAPSSA